MIFPLELPPLANLFPAGWPVELRWASGVVGGVLLGLGLVWGWRYRRRAEQTRRELRRAEERFRRFFEEATVAIIDEDFSAVQRRLEALRDHGVRDLRAHLQDNRALGLELFQCVQITAANRRALAMLDAINLEDFIERLRRQKQAVPPEVFTEELVAIWEGRDTVTVETSYHSEGGQLQRGILQWTLLRENGVRNFARVQVVFTDLTALHASEERYRQLFEGAAVGAYETLPAGGLRTANPAFARTPGFESPAELLAQSA
ncbi:MAG: PAS domain-containing protein, partial [Opitutaceae bacterium]|nr:PAS domain-containing protein [Opitutaceae bacterium]